MVDLPSYKKTPRGVLHIDLTDPTLDAARAEAAKKKNAYLHPLRAELARLREEQLTSIRDFVPESLAELVRGHPAVLLEEAEERLQGAEHPEPEEARLARDKRLDNESHTAAWAAGLPVDHRVFYWIARFVARTRVREMVRDELEKFTTRLEQHYVFTPRSTDATQRESEEKALQETTPVKALAASNHATVAGADPCQPASDPGDCPQSG